ncbi:MAG: UDP-glucose 6-dehydrogenase [Hyphomicrobiales bacterium]|nr:UDP-glucose/GDP-mannose dehydrogenase family protein [Hyphomicrobiales bacterium]PCH49533.1 MAG: UDP-glucose 6-dehydrogenase [Hyphomicrobiales bacterium]
MKVVVIGTGYVGLVSGACFADFGHQVTCIDKDLSKIEALKQGIIPIFEPGLDDLVKSNVNAGRLKFSTDAKDVVADAEIVFIAVGTPSRRGDGHADLSFVYAVAEELAPLIKGYTVITNKSTVPVGTGDEVAAIIKKHAPQAEFDVASNPEFLREGAAIEDFKRPDRVVVGVESKRAEEVLRQLYRPLFLNETPIYVTNRRTAELIKYAANSFLAVKIGFINEISDLCDAVGANVQEVAKGIGLDKRIGSKFLNAGPGYGGSCFPKDTLALSKTAKDANSPLSIVDTVIASNDARKLSMVDRVVAACGGSVEGKTIAALGLTFKPNTDDMRDAPSLVIIPELQKRGAKIKAFCPEGMREAKNLLNNVEYCENSYDCLEGANAAVIITEWDEFRALDITRISHMLKDKVLVDLRNIYNATEFEGSGIAYSSIGRPQKV